MKAARPTEDEMCGHHWPKGDQRCPVCFPLHATCEAEILRLRTALARAEKAMSEDSISGRIKEAIASVRAAALLTQQTTHEKHIRDTYATALEQLKLELTWAEVREWVLAHKKEGLNE